MPDDDTARPIKVARVIARLNVGGPAQHVALLTHRLGPPEFASLLISGRVPVTEGDMAYYAESLGVQPIYVEAMSRELSPLADLKALWSLYRLFRRERPDVVHTHTAKAGFVGRAAAWLAGVPVIVHTFHGHVLRGYFGSLKTNVFRLLERTCAALSTCVLTVSELNRRELLELGVTRPDKMRVVELGLDLQRFADAPRFGGAIRDGLGLSPETPLIGFCGRLVPIKQPDLFLTAAHLVRRERPDAQFVILGDGELREAMEAKTAELGETAGIHFLGWQQDTPPLLADLSLLVLTSANEGTPVAAIEAGAAGVPTVSTAVGGVPDVVRDGETGWLVPDGDPEAVAEAILAALADPEETERRGRTAQAEFLTRFSVDRLAADTAALYRELLAARKR